MSSLPSTTMHTTRKETSLLPNNMFLSNKAKLSTKPKIRTNCAKMWLTYSKQLKKDRWTTVPILTKNFDYIN